MKIDAPPIIAPGHPAHADAWAGLRRLLADEAYAVIRSAYSAGDFAEVQRLVDNVNRAAIDAAEEEP